MSKSAQAKSQSQFGQVAADYVTSKVHAKGEDLVKLLKYSNPQPDWHVLDIATGGGHCAFAYAPHVKSIIATDITQEMLDVASAEAQARGLTNISYEIADAIDLPFETDSFDAVTCRVAAHHFPDHFKFLLEAKRVVKSGGTLVVMDNTVPDGDGGDYINAYEKLRDPSHVICVSSRQWQEDLQHAGFTVSAVESAPMPLEFHAWTERMRVPQDDRTRLKAMLHQAPDSAKAVLTPIFAGDSITFHLERTIFVAKAT